MSIQFKAIAVLATCVAALCACSVNSNGPTVPGPSASSAPASAEPSLRHVTIPGTQSGLGSMPADVWLPPQYFTSPDTKFPVVYLYHGVPGESTDWFGPDQAGPIALSNAQNGMPAVYVAPTVTPVAQPSVDTECVDGPAGNWFTYISKDVPSWVSQNLRVIGDAGHTAAGGLSMGGTCAQLFALKAPNQVSAFANISGTTAAQSRAGVGGLFGDDDPNQLANQYNSTWLITNQPASRSVASWLAVGDDDTDVLKADQNNYAAAATQLGMSVTQDSLQGGHSTKTWIEGLTAWLQWVLPKISN